MRRRVLGVPHGNKRIYDFAFIPNCGFLNSNLPLLNDCELKLSFDRVNAEVAFIEAGDVSINNAFNGTPLVIKDCEAITEYIMCDDLEKYFMNIDNGPIPYFYQECDVTIKSIPKDELNIRFDNVKGGQIPNYIFAGIVPTESLQGNATAPSTWFNASHVKEFNFSVDGNSVNGYPLYNKNISPIYPYYKFMETTSRYMNPEAGEMMRIGQFLQNWIYSHRFDGETSERGWLGVDLKLTQALNTAHSLVIWCVYDCGISIDKFHQIEKLDL